MAPASARVMAPASARVMVPASARVMVPASARVMAPASVVLAWSVPQSVMVYVSPVADAIEPAVMVKLMTLDVNGVPATPTPSAPDTEPVTECTVELVNAIVIVASGSGTDHRRICRP
jgi:hypothetical protein